MLKAQGSVPAEKLQIGNKAINVRRADDEDDETMIDLDPKKQTKKDNVFMDFMAMYSRASINDKNKRRGRARSASASGSFHRPKVSGVQ